MILAMNRVLNSSVDTGARGRKGSKDETLYGHSIRQTENERNENTWVCLRKGELNTETEALIIA